VAGNVLKSKDMTVKEMKKSIQAENGNSFISGFIIERCNKQVGKSVKSRSESPITPTKLGQVMTNL
jgi:hypothetical protein